MSRLVIASNNPGKLREFAALLEPFGIDAIAQRELGIADAKEPHPTFIENALAKARHASAASGLPALADDSGICVNALRGAPGVRSARYADEQAMHGDRQTQDDRNNAKLIAALGEHADRRAHYVCALVLVRRADDPEPIVAMGSWSGQVIAAPRGVNGFGYDPYFLLPELGLTAAELDLDTKNRVSHRGLALRRLSEELAAQRVGLA
ncbi:MAG: RdgB/HAM1 family non-canonical purine NTP pyrophosphatase [Burkholderiaceae bacterium]